MKRLALALVVVSTVVLPACAVNVAQLDPRPNVLLVRSPQSLTLRFDPSVESSFTRRIDLSPTPSVSPPLKITAWRDTLTNGFRNGLARYFAPVSGSTLTIRLLRAEPSLVPSYRGLLGAQIVFQAALVDDDQHVLKTWADTVSSRRAGTYWDADQLLESAVEAMYE